MVNWRSEVNTPLRLNGRRMRSASTPSMRSRSTMPSGCAENRTEAHAFRHEVGAHVLAARAGALDGVVRARLQDRRSSRAPAVRPGPRPSARSYGARSKNDGIGRLSNSALSNPSETKTLATKSPEPPGIGSLWQPEQELESGPLGRVNAGLVPSLRLVGMIACVAFGRPAPSAVGELGLEQLASALDQRRQALAPACGDGVEIDVRGKDPLVPAAPRRPRRSPPTAKAARKRQDSSRIVVMPGASPGFARNPTLALGAPAKSRTDPSSASEFLQRR